MAVNWISKANKVRKALKKDFPETLSITVTETGEYDITTGKASSTENTYKTNGVVKTFNIEDFSTISPEEVEIIFHSGNTPDAIPDLMDKKDITITAYGKIYKVKNMRAVRPAGVTLMYKAIAVESEDA